MLNNLSTSLTQSKSSESYKTTKINLQTLWCIIIIFQEGKNQHKINKALTKTKQKLKENDILHITSIFSIL